MKIRGKLLAAAVAALAGAAAHADESFFGGMLQFHGYGTADVVHSDNHEADFISSTIQPQGAGYTKSWSPEVDSKLALQLDGKFSQRWSAVIQVISENDYNSSWTGKPNPRYRPSLEWANIKFQATPDLALRAGRYVLPMNMLSEYHNVGYAVPFVRPPVETYGSLPFTYSDGLDMTYHAHIGDMINTTVLFAGVDPVREATLAVQTRLFGFTNSLERGDLTARVAYMRTYVKGWVGTPAGLFTNFAAAAASLPDGIGADAASSALFFYDRYDIEHAWVHLDHYEIGLTYDPGAWFAMVEYYGYRNNGLPGNMNSGWLGGGYRYHKFTPYLTFAQEAVTHDTKSGIPLDGLPPPLVQYGTSINTFVNVVNTNIGAAQHTVSAGLRWDFMKNLDLKVQYDRIQLDNGSTGRLTNVQPGFIPGSGLDVFSVAIDFMF